MPRSALVAGLLATSSLCSCGLFQRTQPPAEGFTVADGLELTLWASEPDLVNPTNMAIDERGRIWVTEAINYRRHLKGNPDLTDEGDRILILEDTDSDGLADKRTVFDQNPDIRAPLGIAVLGNKVYVSQSPNVIAYTKDEDDNIVSKEVLLTGWGGYDHDHGVHAVTFGFDGRLYFNSGDQGFDVTDKSGNHVVSSPDGPYYAGTALRVNPDGTDFSVYAHNFRNPYELAMDSFGTIWQTDNDDDGNQWTRVAYVMEGGNFGYWGPGGRRWRDDHGSHFHHELPGVVPYIARTGAGSPTGLVVYEGELLAEKYRGNLIHAEPGKRHIYAFFLEPDGAGYKMTSEELVSSDDRNFRPSDVAVGPDGAVYIADWYDPVVGGHNMQDSEKGRIYRLAPPDFQARRPEMVVSSVPGLKAALRSPDQATRYRAHQEIALQGAGIVPLLEQMWDNDDPVARARALWLIAKLAGPKHHAIGQALAADEPDFRILGLRAARFAGAEIPPLVEPFLGDPDPRVRREAALALQFVEGDGAVEPLLRLAQGYDGEDRWYLEAWAIGARGKEEALTPALTKAFPGEFNAKLADFYWELEAPGVLPYLSRAVRNSGLSEGDRLRALRAIGDRAERPAARTVAGLVSSGNDAVSAAAFDKLSRQLFSRWTEYRGDPVIVGGVRQALSKPALQTAALALADDLADPIYAREVSAIARNVSAPEESRVAALKALGSLSDPRYVAELANIAASDAPIALRVAAVAGIASARPADLDQRLEKLLLAEGPNEVRSEALRQLARGDEGVTRILDLQEAGDLPAEVKTLATNLANRSRNDDIRARAEKLLPPPMDTSQKSVASSVYELLNGEGDAARGREVFQKKDGPKCAVCHSLDPENELAGPTLSAIGSKYDRRGLLDSILNPSAGIAPEYYVYILDTQTQGLVVGVLAADTPQEVIVRNEFGDEIRLQPDDIVSRRKSNLSMMPEDLVNTMSEQELIDLLEFLTTLEAPGEKTD